MIKFYMNSRKTHFYRFDEDTDMLSEFITDNDQLVFKNQENDEFVYHRGALVVIAYEQWCIALCNALMEILSDEDWGFLTKN